MRCFILASTLLAITPIPASAQSEAPPREHHQHATDEATGLLAKLRQGGLVLYFRHERTNMLVQDAPDYELSDCSTQRNLSVSGVASARDVAENIRLLKVPIGRVIASPMCRTLETARYLFGRVRSDSGLVGGGRSAAELATDLRRILLLPGQTGTNTVVVAHISNFEALFARKLQEGDVAVIDLSDREPILLGVIPSSAWNDLVIDALMAGTISAPAAR